MKSALLATKLYLPSAMENSVPRTNLIKQLDAGLSSKLLLISAPAGFGKTTLAANWISDSKTAASAAKQCWLSLDELDNQTNHFWQYFIAALQTIEPKFGEAAISALSAPQQVPIENILVSLINDIAAANDRMIFGLDDYHIINNKDIHLALDFFIEHQPPNLTLLIITREDPSLSLSKLRVRGQLMEIRSDELRFNQQETNVFLNEIADLEIVEEDITALYQRTEGWPAGLRLAALSLEGQTNKQQFIREFTASHRFLMDYLVDEVLSQQPDNVKTFLLRTSILHRLSPELCNQVVEISESQTIIRHLESANLFLIPLDTQRHWYRYHHLFSEFLKLNLMDTEPGLLSSLYQRAMWWCLSNDYFEEALSYALLAKEFETAADLIEQLTPDVLNEKGPAPIIDWIAQFPEDIINERPFLCLSNALALSFSGKMDAVKNYLKRAKASRIYQENSSSRKAIDGYIAAHEAFHQFFLGNYQETIKLARNAINDLPDDEMIVRGRTAVLLGNGLRYDGQMEASQSALEKAFSLSQKSKNLYIANQYFSSQAELYTEVGQLSKAMDTFQQNLDFAEIHAGRKDIPFTGFAYFGIGRIYREWNELEKAKEYILKGVELCREWRQIDALAIGLMELSIFYQDITQYDLAEAALHEAHEIVTAFDSAWGIEMVKAFQVRISLAKKDFHAFTTWTENSKISVTDTPGFQYTVQYHTLIRGLISTHHAEEALVLMEKLSKEYENTGRYGRLLEIKIWMTRAYLDLNQKEKALTTLSEAVQIGKNGPFLRIYLDAGPEIAGLVRRLSESSYRNSILTLFSKPQNHKSKELPFNERFNERELSVLKLMATGKSNQEISDALFLSVNTIRWYARQIYMRLGVKSRGEAVAKARKLDLL
jgi:LuxR family maltose regulon positive regulatory protein